MRNIIGFVVVLLAACSGSTRDGAATGGNAGGGVTNTGGADTGGAGMGGMGATSTGGTGTGGLFIAGGGTGGIRTQTCSVLPLVPEAAYHIVLDASAALALELTPEGAHRANDSIWTAAKGGILEGLARLSDPIPLALGHFPAETDAGACGLQLDVPSEANELELQVKFQQALDRINPAGARSLEAAWVGGLNALRSVKQQNRALILITAGGSQQSVACSACSEPACEQIDESLLDAVRRAAQGNRAESIRTFVIGLPGSERSRGLLSRWAEAGQTGAQDCKHEAGAFCHMDLSGPNLRSELPTALSGILRESCDFLLPSNVLGRSTGLESLRWGQLGSPSHEVPRAAKDVCGSGWALTLEQRPRISLCPEECRLFREAQLANGNVTASINVCKVPIEPNEVIRSP